VRRAHAESLLDLAAELEARDAELGARIAAARGLLEEVDAIRDRAGAVAALLEALPAERAALQRTACDAELRHAEAVAALGEAERMQSEAQGRRRGGAEARAQAEREVVRAREAVADAEAGRERVAAQRLALDEAERDRRAEAEALAAEARSLAARVRELPRLSEAGRAEPGSSLEDLADWGARVHAALFVVTGGLEAERDRVVREAAELGASVLDEPPLGASVAVVRRRLQNALRA
jgi:hypothetical protein